MSLQHKHIPGIAGVASILIIWQVAAMNYGNSAMFPAVTDIFSELWKMFTDLRFYLSLLFTIMRGLVGFFIAASMATLLAATALHQQSWKLFIHPWVVTIRSIPVISLVLIALIWLAPPNLPAFIAFFTMFPILYQHLLSGLEHTDPKLIEMARVFRKNALERLLHIYLPAARKHIYTGISTAMGFGWRAVIIGEVLASPPFGIGTSMKKAQAYINMPELLAWTLIAVFISFGFEYLIQKLSVRKRKGRVNLIGHIPLKIIYSAANEHIILNNINLKFNNKSLFKDFSLRFEKKKIYLLKSASGTGKTTLLNLLAGIQAPHSGGISKTNKTTLNYAFQDLRLIPWLSLYENIAFVQPRYPTLSTVEHEKIKNLIQLLDLTDYPDHLPSELSGGQQQRAVLARALSTGCDLLLLDEPLNGMEKELKQKVVKVIEQITETYQPIIVWATHDDPETWLQNNNYEIISLNAAQ